MISLIIFMVANYGDEFKEWTRLANACLTASMPESTTESDL